MPEGHTWSLHLLSRWLKRRTTLFSKSFVLPIRVFLPTHLSRGEKFTLNSSSIHPSRTHTGSSFSLTHMAMLPQHRKKGMALVFQGSLNAWQENMTFPTRFTLMYELISRLVFISVTPTYIIWGFVWITVDAAIANKYVKLNLIEKLPLSLGSKAKGIPSAPEGAPFHLPSCSPMGPASPECPKWCPCLSHLLPERSSAANSSACVCCYMGASSGDSPWVCGIRALNCQQ